MRSDQNTFRAGAAARDLTPDPKLVDNTRHANMSVRFDEIGSPLQVKSLTLAFGQRHCLLLSLDIVYVPSRHAAQMRAAVAEATGLAADDVVIAASHSHSTPFLEPLDEPHPYFDFVLRQTVDAAVESTRAMQPATIGHAVAHAAGASFNTREPLPDGGVKFIRNFHEASAGRPIDPRLNVLRIDDERAKPIAAWVRFAAHPACVIFDAPMSAEYPGYLTEALSRSLEGAPVLFGYGASGDVNCIPMFGSEDDSRRLGEKLADVALPSITSIRTQSPRRFLAATRTIELPLDPPPSSEALTREIAEIEQFIAALDANPQLEWVLGINCGTSWSAEKKKRHVKPLADWARRALAMVEGGHNSPKTWQRRVTVWNLDDMAIVFESGETLVDVSLALAARTPLADTLLISLAGGTDAYLGDDEDRRRGGYETYTSTRYALLQDGFRPLPYALGASERFVGGILQMIHDLIGK
ncbi:MAG: hypothetical protein WD468_11110 [Pirellulales bacterium]